MLYCRDEPLCARAVDAALVLSAFYADNRRLAHPRLDTPDLAQVPFTLKVHPSPQCRLDTILAGLRQQGRPSCWYKAD
jgi:hypothetical protein